MPAVASFIPRAVWGEKPVRNARLFAEHFRVVAVQNRETSIAPTLPGELYWNFDVPGIVVGMTLLGLGVRFLYRRYIEKGVFDPVRCAFYIVVATHIVNLDGGIAASAVFLIRTIIVLEVMLQLSRYYRLFETDSGRPLVTRA